MISEPPVISNLHEEVVAGGEEESSFECGVRFKGDQILQHLQTETYTIEFSVLEI